METSQDEIVKLGPRGIQLLGNVKFVPENRWTAEESDLWDLGCLVVWSEFKPTDTVSRIIADSSTRYRLVLLKWWHTQTKPLLAEHTLLKAFLQTQSDQKTDIEIVWEGKTTRVTLCKHKDGAAVYTRGPNWRWLFNLSLSLETMC